MSDKTYTNAVTLTDAADFQDFNDNVYKNAGRVILSSVAGTNTITATCTPAQTAYKAGQVFEFVPAVTNTGATTINIGSLGAKNIFRGGAACVGGELRTTSPSQIYYDGTQFNILGEVDAYGQIKFPATPNSSSDANTLDEYEEGTWTPGLVFAGAAVGMTYTSRPGLYTKIGKTVHIQFHIILSAKGSSTGAATITGLPFTSDITTGMQVSAAGYAETLSTAGGLICWISANSTVVNLGYADATGVASLTDANFGNTTEVGVSMSYRATA